MADYDGKCSGRKNCLCLDCCSKYIKKSGILINHNEAEEIRKMSERGKLRKDLINVEIHLFRQKLRDIFLTNTIKNNEKLLSSIFWSIDYQITKLRRKLATADNTDFKTATPKLKHS